MNSSQHYLDLKDPGIDWPLWPRDGLTSMTPAGEQLTSWPLYHQLVFVSRGEMLLRQLCNKPIIIIITSIYIALHHALFKALIHKTNEIILTSPCLILLYDSLEILKRALFSDSNNNGDIDYFHNNNTFRHRKMCRGKRKHSFRIFLKLFQENFIS